MYDLSSTFELTDVYDVVSNSQLLINSNKLLKIFQLLIKLFYNILAIKVYKFSRTKIEQAVIKTTQNKQYTFYQHCDEFLANLVLFYKNAK